MQKVKFENLIETAQSLGWAIKVKTNMNTNLILNPEIGNLEIISTGDKSYVKLKRSLLDIEDITHAYLYSTEQDGE